MSLNASEQETFDHSLSSKFLRGMSDPFLLQPEVDEVLPLDLEEEHRYMRKNRNMFDKNDSAFVSPSDLEDQKELSQDLVSAIQHEVIDYEKYGLDKDAWLGASLPLEEQKKLLGALDCLRKVEDLLASVQNDSEESVSIRSKRKKSNEDSIDKKSASVKKNTKRSKKDKKS